MAIQIVQISASIVGPAKHYWSRKVVFRDWLHLEMNAYRPQHRFVIDGVFEMFTKRYILRTGFNVRKFGVGIKVLRPAYSRSIRTTRTAQPDAPGEGV